MISMSASVDEFAALQYPSPIEYATCGQECGLAASISLGVRPSRRLEDRSSLEDQLAARVSA